MIERSGALALVLLLLSLCGIVSATEIAEVSEGRERYHIAVFGFDGAGDGIPLYNIALEALRRGHRVTFVNEETVSGHMDLTGMEFVALEEDEDWLDYKWEWFRKLTQDLSEDEKTTDALNILMNRWYKMMLPFLQKLFREWSESGNLPDIIVTLPFILGPLDMAHSYGVPAVTVMPQILPMIFVDPSYPTGSCAEYHSLMPLSEKLDFVWCRIREMKNLLPVFLDVEEYRKEQLGEHFYSWELAIIHHRMIVSSVAGITPPIPISPLVEYVGTLVDESQLLRSSFNFIESDKQEALEEMTKTRIASGRDHHLEEYAQYFVSGWSLSQLEQWVEDQSGVVVLAFGTTGMPDETLLCSLIRGFSDAVIAQRDMSPLSLIFSSTYVLPSDLRAFCGDIVSEISGEYSTSTANLPGLKSVIFQPWIPQRNLLAMEKVKMVGSHCGYGSLSESLYFGKPVLAYPYHYDQYANAIRAEEIGVASRIQDKRNAKEVEERIMHLVSNLDSYQKKSALFSTLMKKAGGIKRAVDVLEEEIELGSAHLLFGTGDWVGMNWWDFKLLMLSIFCLFAFLFGCCCNCCLMRCCRSKKVKRD